jgi:LCP family protein required for cell wall assembly
MFEHLDDPVPFHPDGDLRRAVVARGRRRRLARRATALATGMALMVVTVGAAGALYVTRRDAAIDRVDVATEESLDGATNVLVVGTDPLWEGVEGVMADTIVVVRVEPDGSVRTLPIPGDLLDTTTGESMGAAHMRGPQALIDTMTNLTGIPIDHYVEVDFEGFAALVDELGGLRLAVDAPLRDEQTGLDLPASSCTTLDGETALALVRARQVEGDSSGDVGRMARTQAVLQVAVAGLADVGPDPVELDRLGRLLAEHATLDNSLSLEHLVELGMAVAGSGHVASSWLPVVEHPVFTDPPLYLSSDSLPVLELFGAPAATAPLDGNEVEGPSPPTDIDAPIGPC